MKQGSFEKAHIYEKAFSTMRKLKDKRDDKRVLTNLVFGENSAVPVTCKADDITPIFLMKTLEELNTADQKMKRLAGRKVENISKVVKQLEEEVFDAFDMFDAVYHHIISYHITIAALVFHVLTNALTA
jgi:hypothetical protein